MRLLTIGAFARAAGLTVKALRIYADTGLLRPAAVDPESGYRYYRPEQLELARLMARLRRGGMPLRRVRQVCAHWPDDPVAVAGEIARWWSATQAETAAREQLVTSLVAELQTRRTTMTDRPAGFGLRSAVRTDIGRVRTSNEDRAYAGRRLLAVADGAAGPGGAQASSAVIKALAQLDTGPSDAPGTVLADAPGTALADAYRAADDAIRQVGAGTGASPVSTVTALLQVGDRFELVHVGDTRAYRWRGGALTRLTRDDSYVQALVDAGRLDPALALAHRRRALLTQALDGTGTAKPAYAAHRIVAYDRYLLCSDGVWAVVPDDDLAAAVAAGLDPAETVRTVIDLAYQAGAPDNVACVVADVVP
ncbi:MULTISPECIES: MerR family transcriptional regulator [unclassified Solwaraspora]|uniref:MerR family transcriptional regulator n=1 Tax=unclassified Solwaraspora TaxID=2627926 RepID=UPI00248B025A|nr:MULTISPECIES: MerR family transcriptional regulator [unclassified Solwaraspora]WBB96978.1 MerR family transcriptional regulator [Solwaraspora sp. WMMA2059]WBC19118.1 MerR family transcriptional regulator [Solwaraspora sp. WMMA2080]WJK33468.1 MerR family transcriptional regulator [Solwaraspora sp. WMMA2065]